MVVSDKKPKLKKIKKYCTEFGDNTTIHGFRYLVDKNTFLIHKIWWLTAFCLCVYVCISLVSLNWIKWKENPVFLSVSENPMKLGDVPFPAITICPHNPIMATKYNFTDAKEKFNSGNMTEEEEQNFLHATYFCRDYSLSFINHSLSINGLNFIINNSADVETIVTRNLWNDGFFLYPNKVLPPIFTKAGFCFSFNMLDKKELFTNKTYFFPEHVKQESTLYWNFDDNYAKTKNDVFPLRMTFLYTFSPLMLLEDSLRDLDKSCDFFHPGFTVSVHHPAELPEKYIRIELNKTYIFEITPQAIFTNPSLKSYKPERRKCFYSYERLLKFFKIYTKSNCETECLANYTLKTCECAPYYMPHEESTTICGWSQFICQIDAERTFYTEDLDLTSCNCLSSCTSVKYRYDFKTEALQTNHEDNVSVSTLAFIHSDKTFVPMIRNELFGDTDFWANTGGILGLCLGFSAMTLFEIFYYLTLKWMYHICCLTKCFWKRGVEDMCQ